MGKIFLTLEQALKKLNPNLILESSEFEGRKRRRVRTWLDDLPRKYLIKDSSVGNDIYNKGRLEIRTAHQEKDFRGFYTILYEPKKE